MPTVPSREQCECLLGCLDERSRLMAARMGGAGLRLLELVRLPVHDADLPRPQVSVRSGKGVKGAPPHAVVRCARLFSHDFLASRGPTAEPGDHANLHARDAACPSCRPPRLASHESRRKKNGGLR